MPTLYRKYRPQNFEEVVGQNHIKLTLEHEVETDKLAHAYLFCGPRAVGKTTLARVLSKAINCAGRKEGKHEPCNKCDICKSITAGRNLDIIEIDAASHTGVDNVRENIIAQARVAPVQSKYKVFIIDEVHMLSISAFNALLKVIEEPPAFIVFVLCTTEIHKVPKTIISRCQRFDFKRISITDAVKKLKYIVKAEGIKIDKSILEAIARQGEGYMRDTESLLGQIVSVSGKEITQEEADLVIPRSDLEETINLIDFLARKDAASCLGLINKLVDEGVDLSAFLKDLIEIIRKMMFAKISPGLSDKLGLELGESLEIKINEVSKNLTPENLAVFAEQFIKAQNGVKNSFIPQMPIELVVIQLCRAAPSPSIAPRPVSAPVAGTGVKISMPTASPSALKQGAPITRPAPTISSSQVNQNQISVKWNEVLAKIKQHNHSLSFILRVCEPRELSNNRLCLAFKYKFHKDRVDDIKIKSIIEKVLSEVYSAPLTVEAIIDEGMEVSNGASEAAVDDAKLKQGDNTQGKPIHAENSENKGGNEMIDNLLKTFGGKVVG